IRHHMEADDADLEKTEGRGVLNFLVLDDLPVSEEGELVDPQSVISLPVAVDLPVFPEFETGSDDVFLTAVQASGRKWVVVTDSEEEPRLVLDADAFLREAMFAAEAPDPYRFCHRPLVVTERDTPLGAVMRRLTVEPEFKGDDVIDADVILVWGEERRIITGADLLGRLMRGIARRRVASKAVTSGRVLARSGGEDVPEPG
ncbi:MAG: Mg2+ and Co2+ transporter CorB, partial [Myxococcota bacterium]